MADALQKDVATLPTSNALDDSTRAFLRELAAALAHGHFVIANILEANGDVEPLPEAIFRDFIAPSERWYAMFTGTNPGVYQGLENIPNRLQSKASTVRYKSEASAREAFHQALEAGKVTVITNGNERVLTASDVVDDVYGA